MRMPRAGAPQRRHRFGVLNGLRAEPPRLSFQRAPGTPDLVPDLVPKYMVTIGTRWYLLGLAAAPLYQRVPTSPNSHKHNQDSNSLGGTTFSQVRGLSSPISSVNSGYKCLWAEGWRGVKAQLRGGVDAFMRPNSSPLCVESAFD